MSLTFAQIIGKIEDSCGYERGDVQNNSVLLNKFTDDVNIAQDEVMAEALKNAGWTIPDDFNHTKDPFITMNLVSGQRDYHFSTDEEGSLILGYYKVMVADRNGVFCEINPADFKNNTPSTFIDGQNNTGTPSQYLKAGNGIFFDVVPNYSRTAGIKVFIDRESTRFATSDTTKISGIDGLCHDYFYLRPSYEFARDKGLQNADRLFRDKELSMTKIRSRYGSRDKDVRRGMTANVEDCR